jgi:enoyl-CoA hydratase
VLTGERRSFCTGLDLNFAIDLDRPGMSRLMRAFEEALQACYLHPAPVVAAVVGHALAGGALLALCCDRRILADRDCRFGIHGIHLGVSYPEIAIEVLRDSWPRRRVEELLYEGRIYEPAEALARGLVDRVVSPEEVEHEALAYARDLSSPTLVAFALAKASLRRRAAERLARRTPGADESWLDQWFSPSTRAKLAGAREALMRGEGKKPGEIC